MMMMMADTSDGNDWLSSIDGIGIVIVVSLSSINAG